jgi:hypothetical protein
MQVRCTEKMKLEDGHRSAEWYVRCMCARFGGAWRKFSAAGGRRQAGAPPARRRRARERLEENRVS